MYAVISEQQTQLPPGTMVRMPGTWDDYRTLCASRGDRPLPRIKYRNGEIWLMNPMPRHGREANILADMAKVLLDNQDRNYEAFTPITMELPEEGGIEPDYCFYIDQWQAAVGRDRINWQVDPPPDLVLEVDVTSYTTVADYAVYRVSEVWILRNTKLTIYALVKTNDQGYTYEARTHSRYFPGMDLQRISSRLFQSASTQGTGVAIRQFRQSIRDTDV
ncbi:MAG: Uma2 family endonuclease [Cyanobacteria bacterium P01_F01_bin.150]